MAGRYLSFNSLILSYVSLHSHPKAIPAKPANNLLQLICVRFAPIIVLLHNRMKFLAKPFPLSIFSLTYYAANTGCLLLPLKYVLIFLRASLRVVLPSMV